MVDADGQSGGSVTDHWRPPCSRKDERLAGIRVGRRPPLTAVRNRWVPDTPASGFLLTGAAVATSAGGCRRRCAPHPLG